MYMYINLHIEELSPKILYVNLTLESDVFCVWIGPYRIWEKSSSCVYVCMCVSIQESLHVCRDTYCSSKEAVDQVPCTIYKLLSRYIAITVCTHIVQGRWPLRASVLTQCLVIGDILFPTKGRLSYKKSISGSSCTVIMSALNTSRCVVDVCTLVEINCFKQYLVMFFVCFCCCVFSIDPFL